MTVIAIDGPAGAGKSTVARALAHALGWSYLDTGAMYRAVALLALENPLWEPADIAAGMAYGVQGERVFANGADVTEVIREVSEAASRIALDPGVRAALRERQRTIVAEGDYVAEGRDIATHVAPDAALKVYLDADPAERARRRGEPVAGRDARDIGTDGPREDQLAIDTTELSADEVVELIDALVPGLRERHVVELPGQWVVVPERAGFAPVVCRSRENAESFARTWDLDAQARYDREMREEIERNQRALAASTYPVERALGEALLSGDPDRLAEWISDE
jgi:CMP/dCMP kinase